MRHLASATFINRNTSGIFDLCENGSGSEYEPADWHAIRGDGRTAGAASARTAVRGAAVCQLPVRVFFRVDADFRIRAAGELLRSVGESSVRGGLQRERRNPVRPHGKSLSGECESLFWNHS